MQAFIFLWSVVLIPEVIFVRSLFAMSHIYLYASNEIEAVRGEQAWPGLISLVESTVHCLLVEL